MWGRKSRRILALEHRVKDLEERICPCGQHEWKRIGTEYVWWSGTIEAIHRYKCAKCGKERDDLL